MISSASSAGPYLPPVPIKLRQLDFLKRLAGKSSAVCSERLEVPSLARDRDRAQSFNEHLALGAIIDHEGVVIAMR